MNHSLFSALATAVLLLSGCSPKVYTSIQQGYPARPEGSPVQVYERGDTLPGNAERIGTFRITDTGFSTACSYDRVVELAKAEANNEGGNCLYLIDHKFPSLFSTCHQIQGWILQLSDSLFWASYEDNLRVQSGRTLLYENTWEPASAASARAATESFAPHNRPAQHKRPAKHNRPARKVRRSTYEPVRPHAEPLHKSGYSTLSLDAGYAFITSKYLLPDEYVSGNPKQGLDIGLSYQWLWNIGLGIGIRYSGYFSSYTQQLTPDDGTSALHAKDRLRLHYVAPEFVLRQQIGRKWMFHESVGIGYVRYTEQMAGLSMGINGFGIHTTLGVEYKLAKNVGLGFSVNAYSARFRSQDRFIESYTDNKRKAGITRISLDGGLRFYF